MAELHAHKGPSRRPVGRAVWGGNGQWYEQKIRSDMPEKTGDLLACKSCLSFNGKTGTPKQRGGFEERICMKMSVMLSPPFKTLSVGNSGPEEDLGNIPPSRPCPAAREP